MGRDLAAESAPKKRAVGGKVDLRFTLGGLEFGCCECGLFDDQAKQLYDGQFKMVKVLKDKYANELDSFKLSEFFASQKHYIINMKYDIEITWKNLKRFWCSTCSACANNNNKQV